MPRKGHFCLMQTYKIVKLDRRMNGYGQGLFTHCIRPTWINSFQDFRIWLWENYGPSCELNLWVGIEHQSSDWAWYSDSGTRRLLVSERVLTHFILVFPA